jgi:hypothetical protein
MATHCSFEGIGIFAAFSSFPTPAFDPAILVMKAPTCHAAAAKQ